MCLLRRDSHTDFLGAASEDATNTVDLESVPAPSTKVRSGPSSAPPLAPLWPKWAALTHGAHRGSILTCLEAMVLKTKIIN